MEGFPAENTRDRKIDSATRPRSLPGFAARQRGGGTLGHAPAIQLVSMSPACDASLAGPWESTSAVPLRIVAPMRSVMIDSGESHAAPRRSPGKRLVKLLEMPNGDLLRNVSMRQDELFPQDRTSSFSTPIERAAFQAGGNSSPANEENSAPVSDADVDPSLPDETLTASQSDQLEPCLNCSRVEWSDVIDLVRSDHRNFYSRPILTRLGWGLLAAGIVANTQVDRELYEGYHDNVNVHEIATFTDVVRPLGDGTYTLPLFTAAALFGRYATRISGSEVVGDWGSRSLRTVGVGAVPLIALQRLTGAGRPDDPNNHKGSTWTPFRYENGVSGHAFMGAIPFITAAKMTDDPIAKAALYAGSTLTAWSRLQDERHYVSQIALGWWLAYLAATAVDQTEVEFRDFTITPGPMADGAGLFFEWRH